MMENHMETIVLIESGFILLYSEWLFLISLKMKIEYFFSEYSKISVLFHSYLSKKLWKVSSKNSKKFIRNKFIWI